MQISKIDSKPLVSIALPVYNGAETLAIAIRSILQQSIQEWELIILDDGSTDRSLEVIRSFDDPRIRLVEGGENIGLSARLNMAVELSKGTYFARMDQDDISLPERIETQLAFLQSHPEVDLLGTNIAIFDEHFQLKGKLSVHEKHADICAKPWVGFYLPHPTWMAKVSWFKTHHYLSKTDGAEDQNLLMRSYHDSHFACLSAVLLAYRQNSHSFRKLLRGRWRFTKAALQTDVKSDIPLFQVRVAVVQLLKSCGDLLAMIGVPGCKKKLCALQESEARAISALFGELNG